MLLQEVDGGFRRKLAAFLGIDRNVLYRQSPQTAKDAALKARIETVLAEHPRYGHRRIALALGDVGKNRVRRVMRLYGLAPDMKHKPGWRKPGKSARPAPENILKAQGIVAERPGHVWACDFTYLWCMGRWYYLATVIDLYTREIVGWNLSTQHDAELVVGALYDALSRFDAPAYLHFDRGAEYLSQQHLSVCESLEITVSASAKGSPWENGFQERFYGTFKAELGSLKDMQSQGELLERIAITLNYYNTKRIHTRLKTSPKQYRENYNKIAATEIAGQDKMSPTEVRDKVLEEVGT